MSLKTELVKFKDEFIDLRMTATRKNNYDIAQKVSKIVVLIEKLIDDYEDSEKDLTEFTLNEHDEADCG